MIVEADVNPVLESISLLCLSYLLSLFDMTL